MSAQVDTKETFDQEFSLEEIINLYGVYSLDDLDRID